MNTLQESMRLVAADCDTDASGLEGKPFTGRAMGETLGSMLAMIQAVAKAVDLLASEVECLSRTVASRTDHLA